MDKATIAVLVLSLCATLLIVCIWIAAVYKFCYSTARGGGGLHNENLTNKFQEDASRGLDGLTDAERRRLQNRRYTLA